VPSLIGELDVMSDWFWLFITSPEIAFSLGSVFYLDSLL
jgi:hypothetical protein